MSIPELPEDYSTGSDRPVALSVISDAIPAELREHKQWVMWCYEKQKGRWTKVPYRPWAAGMVKASVSDSRTWGDFAVALSVYRLGQFDGIGFVLTQSDSYVGIDLDKCLDYGSNQLTHWAQEIVCSLPTYFEVSPSGRGLRGILRGALPPEGRRKGSIEMYDNARFLTVTGHRLPSAPGTIEDRTSEVRVLHQRIFGEPASHARNEKRVLEDAEILHRCDRAGNAPKYRQLWAGDTSGYTSASEADLALCSILAFYTNDPAQIERLFDRSGLNRDKWKSRPDYRRMTIEQALFSQREQIKASNQGSVFREQTSGSGAKSARSETTRSHWPDAPEEAAYDGLAGEFVTLACNYSEADPVAVLGHFLAAFGCAVGRGPHAMVGATRHDPRLFLAIVGRSGKARKGDSLMPVRLVFQRADPDFESFRIQTGLTSGEGLINAVRDPVSDSDKGVADKRLWALEPEFARLLSVMSRQGNILNAVIRDAWDRGNLQSMTKNTPLKATDAHLVITGHITVDELRRELSDTDAANGFANRFIFLAVRRARLLPEPDIFEGDAVNELGETIAERLRTARTFGRMDRDDQARALWIDQYEDLSAERDGLLGSVLARAEAQVVRLSLIYAMLDGYGTVRESHLQSALAFWRYSERSADYIFGDATGDKIADDILSSLKQRGQLSRTDIYNLFGRHVSSARITLALELLRAKDLATPTMVETAGRPVEVWEARAPQT